MPAPHARDPLYRKITENIRQRFENGEFAPGDQMYSIEETKKRFNVSAITAVRAIDELRKLGLLETVKGKGSYFRGVPSFAAQSPSRSELESLAMVSQYGSLFTPEGFQNRILQGIEQAATDAGLRYRLEHVPFEDTSQRHTLPFVPSATEGLVVISSQVPPALYAVLQEPTLRTVLIDSFAAGAHCVLTDNLAGMTELVDHLAGRGHRSFLLGATHPGSPNPTNENERIAGFRFRMEDRGLQGEVVRGDEFDGILGRVKKPGGPTAVLFTQDDPALAFCQSAEQAGLRVPQDISVTGFDGYALRQPGLERLTTLEVDRQGLGHEAVRVLLEAGQAPVPVPICPRVRGKLNLGQTTAPRPNS